MSHVDEGALHAYLDGALDEYRSRKHAGSGSIWMPAQAAPSDSR